MLIKTIQGFFLLLVGYCTTSAQTEIVITNPSFEGMPHKGVPNGIGIKGWYDCGQLKFRDETPPDLHPINAWEVRKGPSDGDTYLGMVVRDNDTWESVSQRLPSPIEGGKCYAFNIDLSRSRYYVSGSKKTLTIQNYIEPAVLKIYGGTGVCGEQELLGESVTVSNDEWRTYEFKFEPSRTVNYITLVAFYKTPILFPYNGHLLLDNASAISEIPCDEEQLQLEESSPEPAVAERPVEKPEIKKTAPAPVTEQLTAEEVIEQIEAPAPTEKVVEEPKESIAGLSKSEYRKGEIIRINSIYFPQDSFTLEARSFDAIDEIARFMKRNPGIVIEVGGHTNTVPSTQYCDRLSSLRAKEVAKALAKKGVPSSRLYYMGYGKRKPLVFNDKYDMEARKKNQRVEIMILDTDFSG